MAGTLKGRRYFDNVKRRENQPYRTTPRGGRKGCYGFRSTSKYPGEFHPDNCDGTNNRGGFTIND